MTRSSGKARSRVEAEALRVRNTAYLMRRTSLVIVKDMKKIKNRGRPQRSQRVLDSQDIPMNKMQTLTGKALRNSHFIQNTVSQ